MSNYPTDERYASKEDIEFAIKNAKQVAQNKKKNSKKQPMISSVRKITKFW